MPPCFQQLPTPMAGGSESKPTVKCTCNPLRAASNRCSILNVRTVFPVAKWCIIQRCNLICALWLYELFCVRHMRKRSVFQWLALSCIVLSVSIIHNNRTREDITTAILDQQTQGLGKFCTLCQECDHTAHQCALAQQQPPVRSYPTSLQPTGCNLGRICSSWNDGACLYPGSWSYWHVCSICFQHSYLTRDGQLSSQLGFGGRPGRHTSPGFWNAHNPSSTCPQH